MDPNNDLVLKGVRELIASKVNIWVPVQLHAEDVADGVVLTFNCERCSIHDLCILLKGYLLCALRHDEALIAVRGIHLQSTPGSFLFALLSMLEQLQVPPIDNVDALPMDWSPALLRAAALLAGSACSREEGAAGRNGCPTEGGAAGILYLRPGSGGFGRLGEPRRWAGGYYEP